VLEESPCGRWRKMRAEVRIPWNELSLTKVGVKGMRRVSRRARCWRSHLAADGGR
jgi:hypothetical protein